MLLKVSLTFSKRNLNFSKARLKKWINYSVRKVKYLEPNKLKEKVDIKAIAARKKMNLGLKKIK